MTDCTILLVECDENIRKALLHTLVAEGYLVYVASSGAEGLELLKQNSFDVVVSNHLPEMTGLEFLKLCRDRYPDVGRILLTAHADVEVAVQAIKEGEISRFLATPWDDTQLKVTIYTVLAQIEIERENRQLLATVRRQADFLLDLQKDYPDSFRVNRDESGTIVLSTSEVLFQSLHDFLPFSKHESNKLGSHQTMQAEAVKM
jgi:DNA-binding NtrC family response regulator